MNNLASLNTALYSQDTNRRESLVKARDTFQEVLNAISEEESDLIRFVQSGSDSIRAPSKSIHAGTIKQLLLTKVCDCVADKGM